ncbi:SRSF protein kinase 2-like [Hypomesus transpacificus]|uniref:SRSF protein kinase 2-like n=1 Tax=Hypomesus transpacificus TaxID=137520 RepID=UPI001F083804|nr:SRSF protein kinase 2-like [Hypomesus transpacificus]
MSNQPSSGYAAVITALTVNSPVTPEPSLNPEPVPEAVPPKIATSSKTLAASPPPKDPYPPSPEPFESDDDEQENSSDYCIGGYHSVEIGEIFIDRYQVVKKLGWGHFSTVWLCWDIHKRRFVALKVVKSAPTFTETALDEIKLLKCVRDTDPSDPKRETIVRLIDDFRISGENGEHICMVLEVLGHQLLKWIIKSNYTGLPLPCVKSILKQVLQGLDYMHTKCKIIHTDIKPENILLRMDEIYMQEVAANTKLWQRPVSPTRTSSLVNNSPKEKQSMSNWLGKLTVVVQTLGVWSGKVSRSRRKKLSRKEKKHQQLQEGASDADLQRRAKPHVSFSDTDASCSSPSSISPPQLPGPVHTTRRGTLLHEENTDSRKSVSHQRENKQDPSLSPIPSSAHARSTKSSTSGSRSVLLPYSTDDCQPQLLHEQSESDVLVNPLKPQNADKVLIKIADLGNACWVHKHFTEDIQTCQYRSVEVLIGADYGPPADLWSTACMAFELATGEYLFEPQSGENYSREEDHIAHVIELLGPLPSHFALSGKHSRRYFNHKGQLRRISKLKPWSLCEILLDKYEWPQEQAAQFSSFLLTMLELVPEKRASAAQCLKHPWMLS